MIPSRKEESWEDPSDFGRSLGRGVEILIRLVVEDVVSAERQNGGHL